MTPTIRRARSGTAATTSSIPTHRSKPGEERPSRRRRTSHTIPVMRSQRESSRHRAARRRRRSSRLSRYRSSRWATSFVRCHKPHAPAVTGPGLQYPGRGARHRRRPPAAAEVAQTRPPRPADGPPVLEAPLVRGAADAGGRRAAPGAARRVRRPWPVAVRHRAARRVGANTPLHPRIAAAVGGRP